MAKNRGSKEGFMRDPSMSMPSEQKTSESNKHKIARIHDVFPDLTKDNIAKILQFYEDDESKAVNEITRDGGREALSNWADSGSLKSKNSKNKKKKKKAKKDFVAGMTTTASFDADDSSSLHSGGNIDADIEKDNPRTENGNGVLTDIVGEADNLNKLLSNHERLNNAVEPIGNESEKEIETFKPESKHGLDAGAPAALEDSLPPHSHNCDRSEAEQTKRISPLSDTSDKTDEQAAKRDKFRSINDNYPKYSQRQRTSSFRRTKTSSISEDQPSQHNAQTAPTKRGYEKCKKDLNRQTISLQRIQNQLEKGFDDSHKRMKSVFNEIQKAIEIRSKEVEVEMEQKKKEAFILLKSRQDLAVELKRRVDRSAQESEWTELRSDIKQFVTERKYDDDLGKTIWFQWTDIIEIIKSFGEVTPVKNVYSQRSHSALGNSAISSNNPEPSPSSSLANDEIESSADKNDVGNISDAVEDEAPAAGKEEVPAFNKSHPNENRNTRLYFNTRFNQGRFPANHARGFYRGNRGAGGYQNRNNYSYNRQNNNYDNYRNHPHPERDGRVNEGSYINDRNMNNNSRDFKNMRNQGRGHHMNFRYNYPRYRGNTGGGQRHVEKHPNIEPSAHQANVDTEKANVVNGFVNN